MIFDAFIRAISQAFDSRFIWVLAKGLALTVGVLIALWFGWIWIMTLIIPETIWIPFVGEVAWVATVLTAGSYIGFLFISVFLMIPTAAAFINIFSDEVVDAVEHKHYPHLDQPSPLPLSDAIWESLRFLGIVILANIAVLILSIIFIPFAPLIYILINGLVLGREFYFAIAARRNSADDARRLLKKNIGPIWIAGALLMVPMSVPLFNLIIPILGVAAFTHIYHATQKNLA